MKKILFPFTVNHKNQEAFIYAAKLARRTGAELIMLNVYQLEVNKISTKEAYNILVRKNWLHAYKEIVRFNNYFINNHARIQEDLQIKSDFRFIHGDFKKELHKIFDNEIIDIAVISLSDDREENASTIRFIKKEILFRTGNTVLLVPGKMQYQRINNMACIINEAETDDAANNFIKVLKLAKIVDSKLHFIFTSHHKEAEHLRQIPLFTKAEALVEKENDWTLKICDKKEINEAVNQMIKNLNIDMLAVDEQEPGIYERLFHISSVQEILDQSIIPVLVHPLR